MTPAAALQKAVFDRLVAYGPLHDMVADRIYDNVPGAIYDNLPSDAVFSYVSFGPTDSTDADADCIPARIETMQIDCWARDNARIGPVKIIADTVKAALHRWRGDLDGHSMVSSRVELVRCFMEADGVTAHGVVQVSFVVEER